MQNKYIEKVIYVSVITALLIPLLLGVTAKAVRLPASLQAYKTIESVAENATHPEQPPVAIVSFNFGPGAKAENEPQARALLEHLFRKKIKVVLFSLIPIAQPFLDSIPRSVIEELKKSDPTLAIEYGKDWVNMGFRPGNLVVIEGLKGAANMADFFGSDAKGSPAKELPLFKDFTTIKDLDLLIEISAVVGSVDYFLQYLPKDGFMPPFIHGCTSISVPRAYAYLDSGQFKGLMEGVAGAASYEALLKEEFPSHVGNQGGRINTGLGVAQLLIVFFIVLGNLVAVFKKKAGRAS
jgi:hypothetical protein